MQKLVPANGTEVNAPAAAPSPSFFDAVVDEAHVLAEALSPRKVVAPEPTERFDHTPSFAPSTGMRPGR